MRYFKEHIVSLCPELSGMDINRFILSHSQISEASLISRLISHNGTDNNIREWGEVLGSHHEKRRQPLSDDDDRYGQLLKRPPHRRVA